MLGVPQGIMEGYEASMIFSESTLLDEVKLEEEMRLQQQQLQPPQPLQPPQQQQQQVDNELRHLSCNPSINPVESKYEFEVQIPPENNNVVFNKPKLFIKMNSKMTIQVSYREQYRGEQLHLRGMILFAMAAEMHLPVKRCANHRSPNDPLMANILKINDPKASYLGKENGQTFAERLSVVVPVENGTFDDNGKITQTISLEFGCQNSCSSGINRRPTVIVFTLENDNGHLLGKSASEFKVCSCPKRDAEREIKPKRKHNANEAFPHGKRPKYPQPQKMIKSEPDSESDSTENANTTSTFTLTKVHLCMPADMMGDLLKTAYNMIAGKMAEDSKKSTNYEHLEKCLKDIKKMRKPYMDN